MSDLKARLEQCFSLVFPDLSADAIPSASIDTVPAWDSLAGVTLLAVIDEEFGMQVDPTLLPDLTSFDAVLGHLRELEAAP